MKRILGAGLAAIMLYLALEPKPVIAENPQLEIAQEADSTKTMRNPLVHNYYELKKKGRIEELEGKIEAFLGQGYKSIRRELEKGVINDIKYDLKYSQVLGNVVGLLGLKSSEIKINIENSLGEFKIDSIDPDYIIRKKKGSAIKLYEDLNGKKNEYLCSSEGYRWLKSFQDEPELEDLIKEQNSEHPIICSSRDTDVISRIMMLYQNFKLFLGNTNYAEIPLCVDKKERNIAISVERLDKKWYSLKSYITHEKEDKGQLIVRKIFVLLYSPEDSNICLPYMVEIYCQKTKTDKKGRIILDKNKNKVVEDTKLSAKLKM